MTTPTRARTGAPCWIDLFTSDPDASEAFYTALFGWTAEHGGEEYGGYRTYRKDGVIVAGAMHNDGSQGTPDLWTVYLATADAEATAAATTAAGGVVHVPPMAVPSQGVMGLVTGPDQAAVGIWQPQGHEGFGVLDEPGTPCWFELHSRDHDAALDFYREVFGWRTRVEADEADFRYSVAVDGEDRLAGVMDARDHLPEGVPSHWAVYFRVDDTDAAIARALELGGSVVQPAEDTPYGRLAVLADPTGARFRIVDQPTNA